MLGFAIVGLSVGVVTGLGGQLTLGPFAVAAVGAVASFRSRVGPGASPWRYCVRAWPPESSRCCSGFRRCGYAGSC